MSDYTPLYGEMWSDPRWQQLSVTAQWLFLRLKSSTTRNPAGIVEMQPIKWANGAHGATVEQMQDALSELIAYRYIDADDNTQEIMIVGFIETDAIRNQKFYVTTLKAARSCESPRLRVALFKAVQQVHPPDLSGFRNEKTRESLRATIEAAYEALAAKVTRDLAADLTLPSVDFNPSPVQASVDVSVPASVTATVSRGDAMGDGMGDQPAPCRIHPERPAVDDAGWCADCHERERRWNGEEE